jgi:hypothetical protein
MTYSREQLLRVVERSPQHVAVHDREQWLGLFSDGALVEDPVGSPPARKDTGALGRFWDTFIAPHEIRFAVRRDHVLGHDVFRDAVIHTRINSALAIDVPAYLLYQLEDTTGTMRVARMAAHWNLARLSLGALRLGPRAWVAMTFLFGRMIRRMGPAWVAGYLASLWSGIGRRGTRTLESLAGAIASRDGDAASALFTDDATVELGAAQASARALLTLFADGSRLRVDAPVTAGWTTVFRFVVDGDGDGVTSCEGIGLLEFAPASRRIRRARFFTAKS